jgi:hypothetical protein
MEQKRHLQRSLRSQTRFWLSYRRTKICGTEPSGTVNNLEENGGICNLTSAAADRLWRRLSDEALARPRF